MRDAFLMSFVESYDNYNRTIDYLKKHHPLSKDKDLSDEYKEEIVSNSVNSAIRRVVFKDPMSDPPSAQHRYDISCDDFGYYLVISKTMAGTFLLSVVHR